MENGKKRILAAVIAAAVIVILVLAVRACGGREKENQPAETASAALQEAQEGAGVPQETAGAETEKIRQDRAAVLSDENSEGGQKPAEEENKKTCTLTIHNGAAEANTTEAVNAVHVYDPDSEEQEDFFSGDEVPVGTHVSIFVYNLASPVSLTIEHNGKLYAERTYSVMEAWTDDAKVEFFEIDLEGDLTVTTEVLPEGTKTDSTVSINNEALGIVRMFDQDLHDGDRLRNGTGDLTLKRTVYDVKAAVTIDGKEAGSASLTEQKPEAVIPALTFNNSEIKVVFTQTDSSEPAPEPRPGAFRVWWKSQPVGTTEYQIQFSLKQNFSDARSVRVTDLNKLAKTKKGLTAGKTYYVRIRTYKTINGKNYNSPWSAVRKVKAG